MKLMTLILTALCVFVESALASRGEFGAQNRLIGWKTNCDFSGLGTAKFVIVQAAPAVALTGILATVTTSSNILGVLQNKPKVGEAMEIAQEGLSKVVAGGALTANAIFTTNGSGRAAAVTSGDFAVGRILEASGSDGDVVTAQLFFPVRWTGAA